MDLVLVAMEEVVVVVVANRKSNTLARTERWFAGNDQSAPQRTHTKAAPSKEWISSHPIRLF